MAKQNVILIFDVGKTNKKLLLFDEQYNVVHEEFKVFEEITDEDDFPCEDLNALTTWIKEKFAALVNHKDYEIKAVNFSGYGASFVHLDESNNPLTSLYNYLKPYPEKLKQQFYQVYGGESLIAKQTASPVLGSLNSGLQLYRLKYEQPDVYHQIKYSLHLPQYLSFVISQFAATDITSIGCHTQLWEFEKNNYHKWVYKENLNEKFPPVYPANKTVSIIINERKINVGIGLHDSSAALIPYLSAFHQPFVLLSTGTWCISLNPFNTSMLTDYELHHDCLCYLSYEGKPVKASRLFAGYEHEQQANRLAVHFKKATDYYKTINYDAAIVKKLQAVNSSLQELNNSTLIMQPSVFTNRNLNAFETYETAYHQFILDIITQQISSAKIVLNGTDVKRIFVDGGFSSNAVYMNLLKSSFPEMDVFAATIPQASALGAAFAIRNHWNKNIIPENLIRLKTYKW